MSRYTYTSNKDNKTVVAVLREVEDPIDRIGSECSKLTKQILSGIYKDLFVASKYSGVARCMENDEFDENTGKEIARLKAKIKYYKAMINRYNAVCKKLLKAHAELERLKSDCNTVYLELVEKLNKYK